MSFERFPRAMTAGLLIATASGSTNPDLTPPASATVITMPVRPDTPVIASASPSHIYPSDTSNLRSPLCEQIAAIEATTQSHRSPERIAQRLGRQATTLQTEFKQTPFPVSQFDQASRVTSIIMWSKLASRPKLMGNPSYSNHAGRIAAKTISLYCR